MRFEVGNRVIIIRAEGHTIGKIKLVIIAEYLRSLGLVDQTKEEVER